MGAYKDMWAQVDAITARSKSTFEETKALIDQYVGWKFKGCDGIIWSAENRKEGIRLTNRDPDRLLEGVRAEVDRCEKRDKAMAEESARRKSEGKR
jgi:hypothetical protein